MYYLINFSVRGLDGPEKIEKLRSSVLAVKGVKDIRFTGSNKVSVTYDPTKVVPSVLTSIMIAHGIKGHRG